VEGVEVDPLQVLRVDREHPGEVVALAGVPVQPGEGVEGLQLGDVVRLWQRRHLSEDEAVFEMLGEPKPARDDRPGQRQPRSERLEPPNRAVDEAQPR